MLYVYPDNFIVPVIFVENFMNKGTKEKKSEKIEVEKCIKEVLKNDEQEKFRNDDKNECYEKLQEELVMEWEYEGKKIVHYRQKKWYKKKMRNHWRIENSLHHVLDELFHEDRSAARNSKNNMAVLRKLPTTF